MIELTQQIADAITKAIKARGPRFSAKKFAEELGISEPNLSRWRNLKVKEIDPESWQILEPRIRQYFIERVAPPHKTLTKADVPQKSNDIIMRVPPSQQIIAGGVINVYGVPIEKVQNAIRNVNLTDAQRTELILRIFGDSDAKR